MFSKVRDLWYKICDDPILLISFMAATAIIASVILGLCMGWLSVAILWGGAVAITIVSSLLELIFPTFIPERWIPVALPIVGVAAILVQSIANGVTMQEFLENLWGPLFG